MAALPILVFATIFVVSHQIQRTEANSPQIQLAQDTADDLSSGQAPDTIIEDHVNMARSLAPFVIIYDSNGRVVAGSGTLNGQIPSIPIGVLKNSDGKDYNAVTWEPQNGVRIASVTVKSGGYYITSGRSLKEVEKNIQQSLILTIIGLVGALLVLAVGYILDKATRHGKTHKSTHTSG